MDSEFDTIYEVCTTLLHSDMHDALDARLRDMTERSDFSRCAALGYLVATMPHRNKLAARQDFLSHAKNVLAERGELDRWTFEAL